jgi:hypothetical protein
MRRRQASHAKHPLAMQLQSCTAAGALTTVLQGQWMEHLWGVAHIQEEVFGEQMKV